MNDRVRRWIKVFQEFDSKQKKEAIDALNDLLSDIEKRHKPIIEELGVVMGPLGGRCPYCGK